MNLPGDLEDLLAEVHYSRYGLALLRWPKLTLGAYWTAGLGTACTACLFVLTQRALHQWGPLLLGGAITGGILLLIRHGVITSRSRADGRTLSGMDEARNSIRRAQVQDARRYLAKKGCRTQEGVEARLQRVKSRMEGSSTGNFRMPAFLSAMLPLSLAALLHALEPMAGASVVGGVALLLLCAIPLLYGLWLMAIQPFLMSDQLKLRRAQTLLEDVLDDMKLAPPVPLFLRE